MRRDERLADADLQRRFSFFSILGFTCTILITWEAELMYFLLSIDYS